MEELEALESELKQKQAEFIRRERVYKLRTSELNEELEGLKAEKTKWMDDDPEMRKLRGMHQEIVKNVSHLQGHTVRLVQEQERDLLNAFRSRLLDACRELEKEKAKKDDGAAAWIEKSRKLEFDVDRERERADKVDRINQTLTSENARLKQQYETQDDDREFLIKQLDAVKEENSRMREVIDAKKLDLEDLQAAKLPEVASAEEDHQISNEPAIPPRIFGNHSDAAYRDMIKKLNKTLNLERKHVEDVKRAHEAWNSRRTNLERLLRDAVIQIAADVKRRGTATNPRSSTRRSSTPVHHDAIDPNIVANLSHEDREKAIELWLSYDGVLDALYEKEEDDNDGEGSRTSDRRGSARHHAAPCDFPSNVVVIPSSAPPQAP
ncbi:hypothetical protein CTAYLR_005271 [Chrysophaeum taylorii]|uniref:Uncharacterized protein n=1 Tax=Chrysophaeum taylorii TaxID=2483200 RepID=A0AAD7XS87_9STRA|nr:hypothetical protein CTAYLR_005271 [Chrysophaeum taylorii]